MSEQACSVRVGQVVPDFKLTTFLPTEGGFGEFDLAAARKAKQWTAVVFYPADFTFVCATEFAALAELYAEFKKNKCEVVTVSTDTQFTHLAWQREERELSKAEFPMGADPTGKVSRLFGVYDEGSGLALRGSFLISPEGKLTNAEVNFYNVGRNMEELLRKLKANVYLAKNGEQACPANWKQAGDATLTPSPKLVGRVHDALKKK